MIKEKKIPFLTFQIMPLERITPRRSLQEIARVEVSQRFAF